MMIVLKILRNHLTMMTMMYLSIIQIMIKKNKNRRKIKKQVSNPSRNITMVAIKERKNMNKTLIMNQIIKYKKKNIKNIPSKTKPVICIIEYMVTYNKMIL